MIEDIRFRDLDMWNMSPDQNVAGTDVILGIGKALGLMPDIKEISKINSNFIMTPDMKVRLAHIILTSAGWL